MFRAKQTTIYTHSMRNQLNSIHALRLMCINFRHIYVAYVSSVRFKKPRGYGVLTSGSWFLDPGFREEARTERRELTGERGDQRPGRKKPRENRSQ